MAVRQSHVWLLRPSGHGDLGRCACLAAPLWEWAQQAQGPEASLTLMSKDSKDTEFLI